MRFFCSIIFLLYCGTFASAQDITSLVKRICNQSGVIGDIPEKEPFVPVRTSCSGQTSVSYTDFYLLRVKSGSFFTFKITPDNPIDYDFMCWKNPDLKNLGVADRASQNNPLKMDTPTFETGLSTSTPEECQRIGSIGFPEPGFVKYLSVKTGDIIVIAVDMIESTGQSGYNLKFGGDVVFGCALEYNECDFDNDSKVIFDLNAIKEDIKINVYQNTQLIVKFFDSYDDALENGSEGRLYDRKDVSTNIPSSTIVARLETQNNSVIDIFDIKLTAFAIPQLTELRYFPKCDADGNGVEIFDLTLLLPHILGDQKNLETHFYISEQDAQNGTNGYILNPSYYFTSGNTVYLRVKNQNGCVVTTPVKLEVISSVGNTIKEISSIPVCKNEEEAKSINLYYFIPDYSGNPFYEIQIYEDVEDAKQQNSNFIKDPQHYQITPETSKDFYASCKTIGQCREILHFKAEIKRKPDLIITPEQEVCEGDPAVLTASANENTVINWFDTPDAIQAVFTGDTFITPAVFSKKQYFVQANSENGCASERKEVKITPVSRRAPQINSVESGNDFIVINASAYATIEYSIDGVHWQISNQFTHLSQGIYNVYVRNKNACSDTSEDIVIVGLSNFLSPNGDGINDKWFLRGIDKFPESHLLISDRFGKLVFDSNKNKTYEWDGRSGGNILPSDTYWYILQIPNKKTFSGFIFLKNY